MHNFYDLLARHKTLQHLGTNRAGAYLFNEVFNDFDCWIFSSVKTP
jgi:hypothetical protein